MSISSHITSLELKHQKLKTELKDAMGLGSSDEEINRIKKQKLKIKDEIDILKRQLPDGYQNIAA